MDDVKNPLLSKRFYLLLIAAGVEHLPPEAKAFVGPEVIDAISTLAIAGVGLLMFWTQKRWSVKKPPAGPIGAMLLLPFLGGCAFLQETVDELDTVENRVKAAKALTTAARQSCNAATGYLEFVGPGLPGYEDFRAELQADCVKAGELEPAPIDPPAEPPAST